MDTFKLSYAIPIISNQPSFCYLGKMTQILRERKKKMFSDSDHFKYVTIIEKKKKI